MRQHRNTITYLLFLLIYASVVIRGVVNFYGQERGLFGIAVAFMLLYGVLLATEGWISRHIGWYPHLYLALQTTIILILLIISPKLDYFALLFIPLSAQAMLAFSLRTGYVWIGVFALATSFGLIASYGLVDALPFIIIYAAAYLFVSSYATVTKQAEEARAESQTLLSQLTEAHQQLQDYSAQAEKLAVVEERNRLARDLHDSVTQALYSLTLYAEAASRQLAAGAYDVVAEHLGELRQNAQQALQEMRLLIFELRPPVLENEGLKAALRARFEAVESRSGLNVIFNVQGEESLSPELETGLYRITLEALNNVLKHAGATKVNVDLRNTGNMVLLEITDNGKGFDVDAAQRSGGMGLQGMRERAEKLGGTLSISSEPDAGTKLTFQVAL